MNEHWIFILSNVTHSLVVLHTMINLPLPFINSLLYSAPKSNTHFGKRLDVMLGTHIKDVYKVGKSDSTLLVLPLN